MRYAIVAVMLAAGFLYGEEQSRPSRALPADVGPGRVAWFDITTTDLAKTTDFYGKLFDWEFNALEETDLAVEIVSGATAIGTIRVAEGPISAFNGVVYIQVPDIQASCRKAEELGATVVPGFPFNLSDGIGAIGLFSDPAGHPMGMYSRTAIGSEQPAGK